MLKKDGKISRLKINQFISPQGLREYIKSFLTSLTVNFSKLLLQDTNKKHHFIENTRKVQYNFTKHTV